MRHGLVAASAAGLLFVTGPAMAHAFLKTATPAVGSTVTQAPGEVVITFTEGVEASFSTIVVQDASGAEVETGGVHLAGGETRLAIGLKPLPAGSYKVTWHADRGRHPQDRRQFFLHRRAVARAGRCWPRSGWRVAFCSP